MAYFKTTDWTSSEDSVAVVMAEIEAKLETLDSTTNALKQIKITPLPDGNFIGSMLYLVA